MYSSMRTSCEGSATKTGNTYVGDVSHFSFWNCDVPANYVQFNCTLKNSAGNPLPYTLVKVTVVGTNNSGWGYTDSSGYVGGAVPANANLLLEVFPSFGCTTALYSQTFTITNENKSFGTITIPNLVTATVSGTATNCSNTPLINGRIIMLKNGEYSVFPLSNTGSFNFSTLLCSNNVAVSITAIDLIASQESSPYQTNLVAGTNTVGNLQTCTNSMALFINYTINGITDSYINPPDSVTMGVNNPLMGVYGSQMATMNFVSIEFDHQGIALNSSQRLNRLAATSIPAHTIPNPIFVNITEYGPIGGFISGNFTGLIVGIIPPNNSYSITGNFRVRRNF